jgi:hypothetical protein
MYPSQETLQEAPSIVRATNDQSNRPFVARNQIAVGRNASRAYSRPTTLAKRSRRIGARIPIGKQWHSKFYAPRVCNDRPYPVTSDNQDSLDTFLEDFGGSIPSWDAKVVKRFLLDHSSQLSGSQHSGSWAWLDEREHASGRSRDHPEGLDAKQLRIALMKEASLLTVSLVRSLSYHCQRSGHIQHPDVDRRLVYVITTCSPTRTS